MKKVKDSNSDKPVNVHKDHRSRMKKRFIDNGSLDGFQTHEQLEMLLYYACPRKDTNELAHRLLNGFGSFSALCDASVSALCDCGISEHVAVLLKMIPEFSRIYIDDKKNNADREIDFEHLGDFFIPKYIGKDFEEVYLLLLDNKGRQIFFGCIAKGSFSGSDVPVKKIVELTMKYQAYSAVISHNHPSGNLFPSREDCAITEQLIKTLELIDSHLIDHIIVSGDEYISLAENEFTRRMFGYDD